MDSNYNSHKIKVSLTNNSLMHFSNQEKRAPQVGNPQRSRLPENKPHNYASHANHPARDYEDEQASLALKGTDSSQVRDLKGKIKLVMTKLTSVKREKEELQKQNKYLEEEVASLQTNLRQMVSGFSNTSCNFPTYNEIGSKFAEFYKYECLDLFFDVLCPDMSLKGIIAFYYYSFERIEEVVKKYFAPCFHAIAQVGCFETIEGPIMNVLRKAFQTTYMDILANFEKNGRIQEATAYLKGRMNMEDLSEEVEVRLREFLGKILQLRLCCLISDPPFEVSISEIGTKVQFNPLLHDPFDGFIKPKEECWIVLPSVRKSHEDKETVTKALVLQADYDVINGNDD